MNFNLQNVKQTNRFTINNNLIAPQYYNSISRHIFKKVIRKSFNLNKNAMNKYIFKRSDCYLFNITI